MKILRAVLELPAKKHCQSSPFTSKLGQIGQMGSAVQLVAPKRLPGLIFSIAMGANYSFYVKTIETHARAFFNVIIFSIGSVFGEKLKFGLVLGRLIVKKKNWAD